MRYSTSTHSLSPYRTTPATVFNSLVNDAPDSSLIQSSRLSHTLYLYISAGRRNVRVKPRSAGRYHFGGNLFALQIRMMQQECIYARFHLRKVFFVCRTFVTTCRTARVVTVTGTGRPSPEKVSSVNICPTLAAPTTLPFRVKTSALPLFGPANCANIHKTRI